ncbi:DUF423 domain-containing protein [Dongia sp.]|uniref:DUF423 domain-containing protein n=1 Tax=Dongia sp. TaxID=1977262 RepID=UPI0035AE8E5C
MRKWLIGAGIQGAMAVGFGAWAAHGAEQVLEPHAIDWVKTGSSYQLWHAIALLGIAALATRFPSRRLALAGLAFCFGALAFSCSLYGLALGGPFWLVYVTPFGGSLLILGWIAVLAAGFGNLPAR